MDFLLLGPVEILDDHGKGVPLRAQQDRALLALLLLAETRQIPRRRLCSQLWGDKPSKTGLTDLAKRLRHLLQRTFGDRADLPQLPDAYKLTVDRRHVDYCRFLDQLGAARAHTDPAKVAVAAQAALNEWQQGAGTALQNLSEDQSWLGTERQRLQLRRGEAWHLLLAARLSLGQHRQVLSEIDEPRSLFPDDQDLVGYQLLALYRAGRPTEAERVYDTFRTYLAREHDTEPGRELRNRIEQIRRAAPELDAPAPAPAVTDFTMGPPMALGPRPRLVGRKVQVDWLLERLQSSPEQRVLLIGTRVSGRAGVGKTTLAVYAAHEALDRGWFGGGVLFVDLRGHSLQPELRPEDALFTLLTQLGVPADQSQEGDRAALFRSVLAARARAGQRVLIIADNAASSDQVRPLLPGSAAHRVIVTSRCSLSGLDCLEQLDLQILTPDKAVQLLDDHLRGSRHGDQRIATEPGAAAEVARWCGYLPLALKIVASLLADAPERPVAELAELLADSASRLQELQHDDHLGVRVAFSLSYQVLKPEQARLFRLLALNPGAQTSVEAAAALIDRPLRTTSRLLAELRRANLLEPGIPPVGWWRFYDLIGLYAYERVREEESAEDQDQASTRLMEHYLETTGAADAWLNPTTGPDARSERFGGRDAALAWLDIEYPTLVAAAARAVLSGDGRHAHQLAARLQRFFLLRKHAADWITVQRDARAAAEHTHDPQALGQALNDLGEALAFARCFDEAMDHFQLALAIRREVLDRHGEGRTLNNLGVVYQGLRRFDEALDHFQLALAIRREVHDRHGEGQALNNLGNLYEDLWRLDEALDHFQQDLLICREVQDRHGEGQTLNNLGVVYQGLRRFDEALDHFEQALEAHREVHDRHGEGQTLNNLGNLYRGRRRFDEALDHYQQALPLLHDAADGVTEGMVCLGLARVWQDHGDHVEARRWCRQALSGVAEFSDPSAQKLAQQAQELLDQLNES
ncbi:AfsR/SARP family transcriptional regulator [Crossiella sp. CA198]|uniref:AfsR/SARP family transcriptional regulator n=1 Tax=Crossiella sp. CA198 TaxID=3455607 RepID=UPI003F8D7653